MSRSHSLRPLVPGILFLAGLTAGAGCLRADVIYTNFGVGDAYAEGAGVLVTSDGAAWSSVALAFTPAENYTLSSIEFVATGLIPIATDPLTLAIFADNGAGQPSQTPFESFAAVLPGQFGDSVPLITVQSVLQPALLANTQYWIGMNAAPGALIVWNQNLTGANGLAETDGAGNWSMSDPLLAQGAIEIDGTLAAVIAGPDTESGQDFPGAAVPEPGVFGLIAAGLAAIAWINRVKLLKNQPSGRIAGESAYFATKNQQFAYPVEWAFGLLSHSRASPTRNNDPVTNVVIGR